MAQNFRLKYMHYQTTKKEDLLLRYIAVMAHHHNNLNEEVPMVQNDDSRLKEFRQLRNEIRGSTQHLVNPDRITE